MPEGGKRKTTDPLTESSAPRRRRFIKSEPGASYSDPAMWHLKEKKQRKRVQVEAVELHHEPSHYTWSTLHGYPYPYVYANDGVMINKGVKELADRVEEQQVELPSIDLLNGIHMIGANRLFRQHEGFENGIFRRSALFALGVLMEEWAKQTAEDLKWVEDADKASEERDQNQDAAE